MKNRISPEKYKNSSNFSLVDGSYPLSSVSRNHIATDTIGSSSLGYMRPPPVPPALNSEQNFPGTFNFQMKQLVFSNMINVLG